MEHTKVGHSLYLVRHGEAAHKDTDPQRALTESGADHVRRIAAWAAQVGVVVKEIRHSGKLRAEQTANIFGERLNAAETRAVSGLAPHDDVMPVAEKLEVGTEPIMLVGHLPFLARLASLMLCGNSDRKTITMDAGALLALSKEDKGWAVRVLDATSIAAKRQRCQVNSR